MQDLARPTVMAVGVPRGERALFNGQTLVRNDQLRVELALDAQSLTRGAGTVRAVEREGARLDLRQADVPVHARQVLAEQMIDRVLRVGHRSEERRVGKEGRAGG